MQCPKCGGHNFDEIDCGPDGYEDDITYSSERCKNCKLWHDGWNDKWYENIDHWQDVEDTEPYGLRTETS